MELKAHSISVQGPHAPMLHATSVSVSDHQLVLLAGYPGPGHVAVALGLSGRLKPDGGDVQLDGSTNGRVLRRQVAVVDAPGITEPDDALLVQTVVGEELAIAGHKAGRKAVAEWLSSHEWAGFADRRWEHLPVGVRTRMLAELTVARPDVKVVILTMPDRLGGDPHEWYGVGRELASRGYGVIITCADASARLLGVEAAQMGSVNPPAPVQVEALALVEAVDPIAPVEAEAMAPVEAVDPIAPVEAMAPVEVVEAEAMAPAEAVEVEEVTAAAEGPADTARVAVPEKAEVAPVEPGQPVAEDVAIPTNAGAAPASAEDPAKAEAVAPVEVEEVTATTEGPADTAQVAVPEKAEVAPVEAGQPVAEEVAVPENAGVAPASAEDPAKAEEPALEDVVPAEAEGAPAKAAERVEAEVAPARAEEPAVEDVAVSANAEMAPARAEERAKAEESARGVVAEKGDEVLAAAEGVVAVKSEGPVRAAEADETKDEA